MVTHVDVVGVHLWGRLVGALSFDAGAGCYAFEYAPAWRRGDVEIAPLQMPLGSRQRIFRFPQLSRATYNGLPGAIADALPDAFGNALIDRWMRDRGIEAEAITPLDRLSYMGSRAMGALEFRPAQDRGGDTPAPLEMKALVEAARRVLTGQLDEAGADEALRAIIRVGTSAGGARAKAVIAWNPGTHEMRSGQLDVPAGFEHWLLKFDGVGADSELGTGAHYGRIEYAYSLMAREAGIDMMPCRLLEEHGRAHFMTRRFDREDGRKHHVQTLCAMAHLDYNLREANSYEQLFDTARKLGLDAEAMAELFRRTVFNVAARNCDDHTKNFAFMLREGGRWELTPAYDVTHAYNPKGVWTYQHLMSVGGQFRDITRAELLKLALEFGVSGSREQVARVAEAVSRWPRFAEAAGLPDAVTSNVGRDHVDLA